jgi:hypothetical protein
MGFCDNIITIPQYRETCWFNAILMAIFYSQRSRKLLYNHFEGKKDKFSRIMNDIIKHNYIKTKQVIQYFKFMKPENILKYINADTTELYKAFKQNKAYAYDAKTFLPCFLKSLGKNVLDIIIYENNYYANFYSILPNFFTSYYKDDDRTLNIDLEKWNGIDSNDIKDPDYIIVNNISSFEELEKIQYIYNVMFFKAFYRIQSKLNLKTYTINIKGLLNFDDEIYHNGNKYVLDSVLLSNNNTDTELGHAIAGITCKNNHYVYNGWMRTTRDPGMPKNYRNETIPCELMKFDWNVKKDNKFCLNHRLCKLDEYDELKRGEMCFSFNDKNHITLIYVKDTSSIKSIDTNLGISSSLTLPSLKSNTSDFSELDIDKNDEIIKKFHKNIRNDRKNKQELYKKELKSLIVFIKYKSNFYLTIDEYLDKENLLLIKNPTKIIIDNLETDNLGIDYIDQLEYTLNINNYNDITLEEEDSSNNQIIYNGYTYKLFRNSNNRYIYKLETDSEKSYLDLPITLKPVCKKFSKTATQLSNFIKTVKPSEEYSQELNTFLSITSYNIQVKNNSMCVIAGGDNNTYVNCILAAFFNNKNLAIEELFFKKPLKNKNAIIIRNEFKSYYETKNYNNVKLMKAIQMYYNDFIIQNPEYPKIRWANGKYNFTDLIILLQQIFNFNKTKIKILLSYNEKFKIIEKQETTIKSITITKNLNMQPKIKAIITRIKDKYKYFGNIKNYLKSAKDNGKIVSYIYY